MIKHGALSKSRIYELLRSKDARVRRAAFILLETSNPTLRRNSEIFLEIIRFIWDANPSYDVYREFSKRHLVAPYKVHELISARLKIEKREHQSAPTDQRTEDRRRYKGGSSSKRLTALAAIRCLTSLGTNDRPATTSKKNVVEVFISRFARHDIPLTPKGSQSHLALIGSPVSLSTVPTPTPISRAMRRMLPFARARRIAVDLFEVNAMSLCLRFRDRPRH